MVDAQARVARKQATIPADYYRGLSTAQGRELRALQAQRQYRTGQRQHFRITPDVSRREAQLIRQARRNVQAGTAAPRSGFVLGIREALSGLDLQARYGRWGAPVAFSSFAAAGGRQRFFGSIAHQSGGQNTGVSAESHYCWIGYRTADMEATGNLKPSRRLRRAIRFGSGGDDDLRVAVRAYRTQLVASRDWEAGTSWGNLRAYGSRLAAVGSA